MAGTRDFTVGLKLFHLLVKAAGAEGQRVKAITCRCEIHNVPQFTIETLGEEKQMTSALEAAEKSNA